jgi:pimeloyl-ACP methyl ester carboxylesterase
MKVKSPSLLFNSAIRLMALCGDLRQTRPVAKATAQEGDLGGGYHCTGLRRNWAMGGVAGRSQFLVFVILVLFLGRGPLYAEPDPPSRPILFVHGWCGSPYDWAPLYSSLLKTLPDSMYPDNGLPDLLNQNAC